MPARILPLVNGEYYHIYNRGVASQPTYLTRRNHERFLQCLAYYRFSNTPLRLSKLLELKIEEKEKILSRLRKNSQNEVEIVCFCLMPNHFHFLLKQTSVDGISNFMKRITDSYTRYFNVKNQRAGPVFQGAFKAVHIETDEQLLHVSRYIHLNPLVSFVVSDNRFLVYPWSSMQDFLGNRLHDFLSPEPVLQHFKNPDNYLKFVPDRADYGKELEVIKHLILEK